MTFYILAFIFAACGIALVVCGWFFVRGVLEIINRESWD